jgi:hypothetical protein
MSATGRRRTFDVRSTWRGLQFLILLSLLFGQGVSGMRIHLAFPAKMMNVVLVQGVSKWNPYGYSRITKTIVPS